VLRKPGDEQHASLSDGQAALFASLADATTLGIIRYLGDGDPQTVAMLTATTGAGRRAVLAHVDELERDGVLDSHDDTAFTRYDVKDPRILQLLELASEIVATRESLSRQRLPDPSVLLCEASPAREQTSRT
jgi:DNA-binding transcriptional ArsR family regulator